MGIPSTGLSYLKPGDRWKDTNWMACDQWLNDFPISQDIEDSPVVDKGLRQTIDFPGRYSDSPIPSAAQVLMAAIDDKILTLCLTFLENVTQPWEGARISHVSFHQRMFRQSLCQAVQFLPELKRNKNAPCGNFRPEKTVWSAVRIKIYKTAIFRLHHRRVCDLF